MNTKMILEIAGAKPLATSCGAKPAVLNLSAEKGDRGVCENFASFDKAVGGKKEFGAYDSGTGEVAAVGLGLGMWKGVFG